MENKILRLVKNPKKEYKNIFSFFKRNWILLRPGLFEFFGIDKYSKPYPQHDELIKHLNFKNGFFVEVGGNDGFSYDPTYYLEKFKGWKGVIVEPLSYAKKCKRNRSKSFIYNVAAGCPFEEGEVVEINECGPMSIVECGESSNWVNSAEKLLSIKSKKILVKMFSLTYLLNQYFSSHSKNGIDLLVIDVEGYEPEVIKGIDFSRYTPKYILVEAHSTEKLNLIKSLLPESYGLIDKMDEGDYLFKS